jgi:polyhydroxyalkanoate synthase
MDRGRPPSRRKHDPAATPSATGADRAPKARKGIKEMAMEPPRAKATSPFIGLPFPEIAETIGAIVTSCAKQPGAIVSETKTLLAEAVKIANEKSDVVPAADDRRFSDRAWKDGGALGKGLKMYLTWARAMERLSAVGAENETEVARRAYATSLLTDAIAPSNVPFVNPAFLSRLRGTRGVSLVEGMANLAKDVVRNGGMPSQVDETALRVGVDLAATRGSVILRLPELELVEYATTTECVREVPILLIPPVVNKHYLFDVAPGRSLVEHLVKSGFRTFCAVWDNPGKENAGRSFSDIASALVKAAETAARVSGSDEIQIATICTGGIPTAMLLSLMKARSKIKVVGTTFLVAVLDGNSGRSLGLFSTPKAMTAAKRASAKEGVLDGRKMRSTFSWMRPNDLVWPYAVDGWLMGRKPKTMDLLHWNNDSIRMSARMHSEIIDIFANDLLGKPGGVTIDGVPINVAEDVECPSYVVGGATDHISLWRGCYATARIFKGPVRFVLHSSGHVQTVVAPMGSKASHLVIPHEKQTETTMPEDPETWLAEAEERRESWWADWTKWLRERCGDEISVADVKDVERPRKIADAPGEYALKN